MPEADFTIARVIGRLNIGGPAVQAILMTDAFRKRGYRTLLITGEVPPTEGSMEHVARGLGVVPIKLGTMSRKVSWLNDLITLWQLIRIFRHEKPLLVHTHTAKAGTVGRLAAVLARVPVRVHTFHGHVFHGYFSPLATWVIRAVERLLAAHTDCIIAISESQKRDLAELYSIAPARKIAVIPLGLDLDRFLAVKGRTGKFRESLGCKAQSFFVGWVGRLTAIKDPDLFLACASELAAVSQEMRFVVVGDGELQSQCRNQVRSMGLEQNVALAGWQKYMDCVYADLDLVVLTSINEGTPLSLLEAMAAAKAFVAVNVGGVRDLMIGSARCQDGYEIFSNGILVPRDSSVIVRAVSFLFQNAELRRAMGNAGREFVSARFTTERLADDLEDLYLFLAGRKRCIPSGRSVIKTHPMRLHSSAQKHVP